MTVTDLSNMDMEKFGCLDQAKRIWAVAAIHGDVRALSALHDMLLTKFRPGDQLVYLGNYFGNQPTVVETLNELLLSRRKFMAMDPETAAGGFVYLRGAREEMLTKLLQLQFAPNPAEVMDWLVDHHIGAVVDSYGTPPHVARAISREGTLSISRWTSSLRRAIHNHAGHSIFLSSLRRAAFCRDGKMLFVHASIDTSRPVTMQKDNFWWDNGCFDQITEPYGGFSRVVRGYDHGNGGLKLNRPHAVTLDGGCGRGGALNAVCFTPDGDVADQISIMT